MELRFKLFYEIFLIIGLGSFLVDAACKADEWSCEDGTCIDAKLKCNGAYNCLDKSDETFVLCRNTTCDFFKEFRCVYGGCITDKSVVCNGVQDCVDNSDELVPECRNETVYATCIGTKTPDVIKRLEECFAKENSCKDGTETGAFIKCNGKKDCEDGSDETLEACSGSWIPNCIGWKFRCQYGGCIEHEKVCNGVIDCADGSDELDGICNEGSVEEFKSKSEWNCKDGNRIDAALKCNGKVDCPDGSDETILECHNNTRCPFKYRKCVYGACVKNSAFCDGKMDCADNSDELLHECRNETTYNDCYYRYTIENRPFSNTPDRTKYYEGLLEQCDIAERTCDSGQLLTRKEYKCDGKADCDDGSDETLETCATTRRGDCEFRCRTGGCISSEQVCNNVKDCVDGTDELDALCYAGKCVLPEHPAHGNYTVQDQPDAAPGQTLDVALLVFSCDVGYKLHGTSRYVNCLKGNWPYEPPVCLAQCELKKHPSTTYWCLGQGPLASQGEKECGTRVPAGATVRPECSDSIYHYTGGVLTFMHCVDGEWDRPVPTCTAQCGLVTSQGDHLIINGKSAERGELPWHAAIYDKRTKPYLQICGGSLISQTIVISAAHCFWSDLTKLLPVRFYAVALGKLYRPWNDMNEVGAQKFNVRSIKIPPRFKGAASNFQEDIALVFLGGVAEYRAHVLPVCLDFNLPFERRQLATGNSGKVAGWGLTEEDGKASPVLKVAQLPFLEIDACYEQSPTEFYKFITGDKFCAGGANSSSLCKGDSGGGLVFASHDRGEKRYFLRGVVSTAPRNDHLCNAVVHTTFTLVSKHQAFILEYWNDI